jgi:hypothetical protein
MTANSMAMYNNHAINLKKTTLMIQFETLLLEETRLSKDVHLHMYMLNKYFYLKLVYG